MQKFRILEVVIGEDRLLNINTNFRPVSVILSKVIIRTVASSGQSLCSGDAPGLQGHGGQRCPGLGLTEALDSSVYDGRAPLAGEAVILKARWIKIDLSELD